MKFLGGNCSRGASEFQFPDRTVSQRQELEKADREEVYGQGQTIEGTFEALKLSLWTFLYYYF